MLAGGAALLFRGGLLSSFFDLPLAVGHRLLALPEPAFVRAQRLRLGVEVTPAFGELSAFGGHHAFGFLQGRRALHELVARPCELGAGGLERMLLLFKFARAL